MKIVLALLVIVAIIAVIVFVVKRSNAKRKPVKVASAINEQINRELRLKSSPSKPATSYHYSGQAYDTMRPSTKSPAPKPVKRKEEGTYGYAEAVEVPDGYVADYGYEPSWKSEETTNYSTYSPDPTPSSNYDSNSSSNSSDSSSYSTGSSSSYDSGSSSSSSYDSGSSSSSSDSGSY